MLRGLKKPFHKTQYAVDYTRAPEVEICGEFLLTLTPIFEFQDQKGDKNHSERSYLCSDQRDSFRMIETKPAGQTLLRKHSCSMENKLVHLPRGQLHGDTVSSALPVWAPSPRIINLYQAKAIDQRTVLENTTNDQKSSY